MKFPPPSSSSHERTLVEYLEAVAAGAPAPGGGSVAAIAGALAAALGEMVANLTLGREQYADAETVLRPVRDRLTALRKELTDAAAADERAYAAYRAAVALPRSSDVDKAGRIVAVQQALAEATDVPLGVARVSAEISELLETVARAGNPHVRSDAALGALLAETALRGALLNVRGNAALLQDRQRAAAYRDDADRLENHGREAAARAYRLASDEAQ